MEEIITKAYIRKLIREGLDEDKLLRDAVHRVFDVYSGSVNHASRNTAFSAERLYEELKAKGYEVGDNSLAFGFTVSEVHVKVDSFGFSLPGLPYINNPISFSLLFKPLSHVINLMEKIPQMHQKMKDSLEFIKTNYDDAYSEVLATRKAQKLKAGMSSCFVKKLLDSKNLDYTIVEQNIQSTIIVKLPPKRTVSIKYRHSKLLKERETLLQSISQTLDLFVEPLIPVKLK